MPELTLEQSAALATLENTKSINELFERTNTLLESYQRLQMQIDLLKQQLREK